MTIGELFMRAIMKSFYELVSIGRVHYCLSLRAKDEEIYKEITESTSMKGLFLHLMEANKAKHLQQHFRATLQLGLKKI